MILFCKNKIANEVAGEEASTYLEPKKYIATITGCILHVARGELKIKPQPSVPYRFWKHCLLSFFHSEQQQQFDEKIASGHLPRFLIDCISSQTVRYSPFLNPLEFNSNGVKSVKLVKNGKCIPNYEGYNADFTNNDYAELFLSMRYHLN